jgi:serine/threonine protein kinase
VNNEHEACIADFGVPRILEVSGFTTTPVDMSCRWTASELIACEYEGSHAPEITEATDVWAFGMTVLEVRSFVIHFIGLTHNGLLPRYSQSNCLSSNSNLTVPLFMLS